MGALYLDGIQIGDDGRNAVLPDELNDKLAAAEAERRERARVGTEAVMAEHDAESRAAARPLVNKLAENAANLYQRFPIRLFNIRGLAPWSTPEQILAVCDSIRETRIRRFGEEVEPINRAGARRYAERMIAARQMEAAE